MKKCHLGAACDVKARVQALQHEFETMFMSEEESVVNFARKLSKVTTQLRSIGQNIDNGFLVAKLLREAHAKSNSITSSIEK